MAYNATNPNGQATSANSSPVVIASDNVVDTASNQVIGTGTITAADSASTTAAGQSNQVLISGSPSANSAYSLAIPNVNGAPESFSSVVIGISGTFVGTYQFERSPDNGTTWTPFSPFIAGQAQTVAAGTLPGMFHGNISGVTNVRVRSTSFTSGTITVRFSYGIGTGTITVGNPIRLYDLGNNTQATIKPASTVPAATDTAIVTVESPNSPLIGNTANIPAKGQTTMANSMPVAIASDQSTVKVKLANDITSTTGSLASATATVATGALSGVGSATVSIYGTYAGLNVTFEGSDGTGSNWVSVPAQPIGSVTPVPVVSTGVITANATLMWNISPVLGLQYLRVRATAWTSGSASVLIAPSAQFTQPIVSIGSGTVSSSTSDAAVSGVLGSLNATVVTNALNGSATATIQVFGTWVGTMTPSASVDGTNFVTLGSTALLNINTNALSGTIASAATGIWQMDVSGYAYLRVIMTAYTSGSPTVTIRASVGSSMMGLDAPLPTGSNTIGNVSLNTGGNTIGSVVLATGISNIGYVGPAPNYYSTTTGLTTTNSSQQSVSNTPIAIRASSTGRLYEYDFYNPNTSGVWVQIFNVATAAGVTLGTTVPVRTVYVPASSGRDWASPHSMIFTNGIIIACTTTNLGSTAPANPIQAYVGVA